MSRFDKLEISSNKTPPPPPDDKRAYDEVYYMELARRSHLDGDFEEALKYYSRALGYKKECLDAWLGQVLCLIDLGEFHEAVVWADKGLEVAGSAPGLLAAKAMALGRNGELDKALGFSDQSIKKGANLPILWLARGDVVAARELKNAEHCFRKAIECGREDPFTYLRIGLSLMTVNENATALGYLKQGLPLAPKSPLLLFLIGRCYQQTGIDDQARNYLSQALAKKPDFTECREALEQACQPGGLGKLIKRFFTR